jgi:hypothetical protein
MNADQIKQAESISKAIATLQSSKAFKTPRISKRLEELIAIQKRIHELKVDQGVFSSYVRGGKTLKYMRECLRKDHLDPLSSDGKVLLEGEPGIEDSLRLPKSGIKDAELIKAARRIIKNIEPFQETFVAEGYDRDFLEKAEKAVDELERASSQPPVNVSRRSRATSELPAVIRRGRGLLGSINRLVVADLRTDAAALSLWKQTYRLPGIIGRPKKKKNKPRKPPPEE